MVKKSPVLTKLTSIERKINQIGKEEKNIERKESTINTKLTAIVKEEKDIDKILIRFAGADIKKRHLYEILRAAAGAFLGVGLGRSLLGLDNLAKTLPWINVFGILAFVLILSALLIYKTEKEKVQQHGRVHIAQRLVFIYLVSVAIEILSLLLFKVQFDNAAMLIKIVIVGSYTAMASAVSFSLDK